MHANDLVRAILDLNGEGICAFDFVSQIRHNFTRGRFRTAFKEIFDKMGDHLGVGF